MLENPSKSRKLVLTSLPNTSPLTSNSCLSVLSHEAALAALLILPLVLLEALFPLESESSRSLKRREGKDVRQPKGCVHQADARRRLLEGKMERETPDAPVPKETCGGPLTEMPPFQALYLSLPQDSTLYLHLMPPS